MERLSIIGDFFDCQLYDGRLYLWTFDGSLQVYNYRQIIDSWHQQEIYESDCFGDENGKAPIVISTDKLREFIIYERDYFTPEYPLGTEVIGGELYEANALGLFKCHLPVCDKRERANQITDVPMISIKGARKWGLVCAAGSYGLFWLPVDSEADTIKKISERQSIDASFCTPGLYVYSANGDSFLMPKMNSGYSDEIIIGRQLFPVMNGNLTWVWNDEFYAISNNVLKAFHYSKHGYEEAVEMESEEWNGKFVGAETTRWGTVIELNDSIRIFTDLMNVRSRCNLYGEVTRWRTYPRSSSYSHHIHIIFDDRMDIVAMENKA